ncbi:cytochrome P450 [Mycena alexandri]|uniref:Cytochrome P450 n=1 Tax=Mycena alexandri TaxID=1745969 RepID=A0AAD6X3U8_9AGAR|nr:cytochrome P450 [Mycena alexandri]
MPPVDFGLHAFLLLLGLWLCTKLFSYVSRAGSLTTKLNGPPSQSRIFGLLRYRLDAPDISTDYEEWAARYGPVFEIPVMFGAKQIMLTDPKALTHCYNSERAVYVKTNIQRLFIDEIFGRGVLSAEGENHKRQRKALTPAFSNAAIRRLTAVFYDSAYKLKSIWDERLESTSDGAIIEVQEWMNRIALDSIGIAGFSHDFRYIEGQQSAVTTAFEAISVFPVLLRLPTQRMRLFWDLRSSLNVIAQRLLVRMRSEKEAGVTEELADKSIIGLLMKAELADAELHMSQEEVVAQVECPAVGWIRDNIRYVILISRFNHNLIFFFSVSLTWALIELAKCPEAQDKLRDDLARFNGADPTWDQLVSELPYLDATVLEILRLHPPVSETLREAIYDDIIPLGTPIVTRSGETVSSDELALITVAKGSIISEPIRCINRSESFWGPDAKEFKPERWIGDITVPAKEFLGHRHLLTFHDGPRICLGKSFALAEFKAVLSVLVRNFVFEFPDGPTTKIEHHDAIVPRPKVAGQNGAKVPMKVRRVE